LSTTLSPRQIQEAIELASPSLIKQLNSTEWSVHSLNSESSYKVKVADSVHAYDLWCTCSAWKFKKGSKDCKHCEAVRVLTNQPNQKQVVSVPNGSKKKRRKTITKAKPKPKPKPKPKNVKVTCWHCGNEDQKIQSIDEAFTCTNCQEDLWVGEGGYVEQVGGIYR